MACKAWLIGLTTAMALEFGHWGITANVVAPGITDTTRPLEDYHGWPPTEEQLNELPIPRMGRSEEMGAVRVFLMSSSAGYITAQTIPGQRRW